MPAWALKLAASLVLAMTLTGSVQYVSAHPKNASAPLQPVVTAAAAEDAGLSDRDAAIEDVREARHGSPVALPTATLPPTPTPPPTPSPRPTPTVAGRTATPATPTARPAAP